MNVVHDEALHERTQYIYFNLNEWVCDSANYLIFPNVIFYLFQFLEDKSVKNLGLSFIENFIHYLTHDLYKPDETVVSLPDPSDLKNADDKTKEIGEKILKTTAEQMFTYENVIYSLQLGQVAGLFDINLPLVPPTVHKNLDIRQTEGKRLDIAYFPSYMEFEEFFIKQTSDSQKKASLIIAREFTRTLETHKVKYIKYALNALILINEKPALAKYLKPSQKMQEDNCVPV